MLIPLSLVEGQDEKEGGLVVGPAPPSNGNLPSTEKAAMELTSPGRRNEAYHANGMTAGDQSREDVSSTKADRYTRVGSWHEKTLFRAEDKHRQFFR